MWTDYRPFGIGYQEAIIVLIVVFILFGHRLPSVVRSLGRPPVDFRYREHCNDRNAHWIAALDMLMICLLICAVFAALAVLLMARLISN